MGKLLHGLALVCLMIGALGRASGLCSVRADTHSRLLRGALKRENFAYARSLLEAKADASARLTRSGDTPLHLATHSDFVLLLYAYGCDPSRTNQYGQTALMKRVNIADLERGDLDVDFRDENPQLADTIRALVYIGVPLEGMKNELAAVEKNYEHSLDAFIHYRIGTFTQCFREAVQERDRKQEELNKEHNNGIAALLSEHIVSRPLVLLIIDYLPKQLLRPTVTSHDLDEIEKRRKQEDAAKAAGSTECCVVS